MLGKLFKYDFIFIQKGLVPYYFLMIAFALVSRLTALLDGTFFSIISSVFSGTSIGMMVGSIITCVLRGWSRFRNNFYKDESYLTHTLPISKSTLFSAKTLTNIVSLFTVFVAIVAALFVGYYSEEKFEAVRIFINNNAAAFGIDKYEFLSAFFIVLFLELLFTVLMGNFSIVIGHKAKQSKIGVSIIVGIITYFSAQTISLVLLLIFGLFNSEFFEIFKTNTINPDIFMTLIWLSAVIYFVYCIVMYLLGNYAFKKGVNVE